MTGTGEKFILADRFIFDSVSNSLIDNYFDDELTRLGSNESRILLLLVLNPNKVVTRNELYDFVWRDQGFEVDDSSLTQAISTLRKQLKDSTKSPQFIKTVPKRGYQLISKITDITSTEAETEEPLSEENAVDTDVINTGIFDTSTQTEDDSPAAETESKHSEMHASHTEQFKPMKRPVDWVAKAIMILAILLPVSIFLFTNPTASEFRTLESYEGITVDTPINHPDLTKWLPSIEMCINQYMAMHNGEYALEKVIATGGQNEVLILNYIHKPEQSAANITLKIVADKDEINKVCQRGALS